MSGSAARANHPPTFTPQSFGFGLRPLSTACFQSLPFALCAFVQLQSFFTLPALPEPHLSQVLQDLISSPEKFSLQVDEITDIYNLRKLVVFVRYMKDNAIKEGYLFCEHLTKNKAVEEETHGNQTRTSNRQRRVKRFFIHLTAA